MRVPKPQELPSGKFRVQFMLDGKRISVIDDDPDRAQAKAVAIRARLIQERKPTTLTVGRAIDKYIESKDAVLSPATVAGYKRVRNNLMQDLIPVQLSALTQEKVQRSINRMVKDGKRIAADASAALSGATIRTSPTRGVTTTGGTGRGYATGTPNASPGAHIVGEHGPEVIMFNGGERVMNAAETATALGKSGGSTFSFAITIQGDATPATAEALRNAAEDIKAQVLEAIEQQSADVGRRAYR